MLKVYLSHPISTTGEFNDSIRVAKRIEKLSKHVYVGDAKDIEVNGTVYEFEEGSTGVFVDTPKFEVYAPALNKEINDKNNDPTPEMIYEQDVDNLLNADVVVINYTGGDADGTVLELGMLAGMYEMFTTTSKLDNKALRDEDTLKQFVGDVKYDTGITLNKEQAFLVKQNALNISLVNRLNKLRAVYVYSSNKRALQPQLHNSIASGKLNHMVLGAIDKYFNWCGTEDEMLKALSEL